MSERQAPPPGTAEKLTAQRATAGPAKRKLATLKCRLGYVEMEKDAKGPLLIRVKPMLEVTHWRRKDGQTGTQDNWEFEQEPIE